MSGRRLPGMTGAGRRFVFSNGSASYAARSWARARAAHYAMAFIAAEERPAGHDTRGRPRDADDPAGRD